MSIISRRSLLHLSLMLSTAAFSAAANHKPEGAKPADPELIYELFAGKTSNLHDRGHAYWAPDGTARGVGQDKDAYSEGMWYVTDRGKFCHEATWYWELSEKTESETGKWCWEFVTTPDGQVWQRYLPEDTSWGKYDPRKQADGEPHKAVFERIKNDLTD